MTTVQPRPLMVTLACLFAGVMALQSFVTLSSALSDWGSLEVQEWLEPALEDLGLGMDEALATLRVVALGFVLASASAIVFAIFTVRGDRSSRVALSVLCAIGAFAYSALGTGGLLPAILLLACVFILWSPEARLWFEVKNGRTPSPALAARVQQRREGVKNAGVHPGASAHGLDRPGAPTGPVPVPRVVTQAGIVMLIGSLVAGAVTASNALLHLSRLVAPEQHARNFGDGQLPAEAMFGLTASTTVDAWAALISAGLATLAGVGVLVAIALLVAQRWALLPAVVLSWVAVLLSVVVVPWGLPITVAAVAVAVLLRGPEVRAWSTSRPADGVPPHTG